jgi:hypothetical protein
VWTELCREPPKSSTSYLLKIHFNITLPATPKYSKCCFPGCFPTKVFYSFLI